jgi:protein arginine N-methyltransferase 1
MPPTEYQEAFSGWKSQRGMLVDHVRTLAFRDAINAVVREGDRVIDVGTGSGVLAMFAARRGAGEVYALEVTDMADWAQRIAARNGLTAMKVIRGDGAAFASDRPADVVMGEFAGMTLLDEWRHYAAS